MRSLYMGSILKLEDTDAMHEHVREFWKPRQGNMPLSHELYTKIGSEMGDTYAQRLHAIPNLTYCDEEEHREYRIDDVKRGISGRVDVILDFNLLMRLGVKTPKELSEAEEKKLDNLSPKWAVNELKTTGSNRYKQWQTFADLPIDYQLQLSLYAYYLFERKVIDEKAGFFTIISRDTLAIKTLWGECRQDLVDRAFIVAEKFWKLIQDKSSIGGVISQSDITAAIKEGNKAGREWPKIAKI